MFFSPEGFIARRYLWASRKEGFVAVIAGFSFLGIGLGVATLVVVMSIMNGFREELVSRVIGFNGHLLVSRAGGVEEVTALQTKVERYPQVRYAAPLIQKQILLTSKDQACGAMVQAVSPQALSTRSLIAENVIAGHIDSLESGEHTVMLGQGLARKLGVQLGDAIKVTTPEMSRTAFGSFPKTKFFKVSAIFASGMYEYDQNFCFIPIALGQSFLGFKNKVTALEIFLKNPEALSEVKKRLVKDFPTYYIHDWQQANEKFFSTLEVQRNIMFIILMLIVLVAAFNIISCLMMLVKDKTKDIALLQAIGASPGSVLKIFFYVGASIGVVGALLGTGVGLLLSYKLDQIRVLLESMSGWKLFREEIYFLARLPSKVDLREASFVCVSAILLSLLATWYPARRASRLDPVEGLRYE